MSWFLVLGAKYQKTGNVICYLPLCMKLFKRTEIRMRWGVQIMWRSLENGDTRFISRGRVAPGQQLMTGIVSTTM